MPIQPCLVRARCGLLTRMRMPELLVSDRKNQLSAMIRTTQAQVAKVEVTAKKTSVSNQVGPSPRTPPAKTKDHSESETLSPWGDRERRHQLREAGVVLVPADSGSDWLQLKQQPVWSWFDECWDLIDEYFDADGSVRVHTC